MDQLFGFLIGALLIVVGAAIQRKTMALYKGAVFTQGDVIAVVSDDGESAPDDGTVSYPVVRFRAPDGGTIHFKSAMGSHPPRYRIGDKVRVVLQPSVPQNARIDDFWTRWIGALVCGVGLFVIWVAIDA